MYEDLQVALEHSEWDYLDGWDLLLIEDREAG